MSLKSFTAGFPLPGALGAGLARLAPLFRHQAVDEPLSDYSPPPRLEAFLAYIRENEGRGPGDGEAVFHSSFVSVEAQQDHV